MKTLRYFARLVYRRLFLAASVFLWGRLPVKFNSQWMWWPRRMWPGLTFAYEPHMNRALRALLRPGMGFADIGAHHGMWAGLARVLVGGEGVVIACEPSPAFATLAAHLEGARNVELINAAVGAEPGTQTFFAQGEATSGSMRAEVTAINQGYAPSVAVRPITVPVVTLPQLLGARLDRRWVVKVDVEGYEAEVLRGAGKLLASEKLVWLIEIHPAQLKLSGGSEEAVIATLEQHGHQVRIIDRNPNSLYTIFASKDPAFTLDQAQ